LLSLDWPKLLSVSVERRHTELEQVPYPSTTGTRSRPQFLVLETVVGLQAVDVMDLFVG